MSLAWQWYGRQKAQDAWIQPLGQIDDCWRSSSRWVNSHGSFVAPTRSGEGMRGLLRIDNNRPTN